MKIKRILLTGDDGYNSIGTRLLIHFLKDKYQLCIAATKVQQSGVGGKLNIKTGGKWGEVKVDGIQAIYVTGTPGDAMEVAKKVYRQPFDLVISGINLGPNLVGELASGTMTAAVRAIKLKVAPLALALSWNAPASFWYHDHQGDEDIASYHVYPGQAAFQLINLAIKNNFWDNLILNVNFPDQPTEKVKFTRFAYYFGDFYSQVKLDQATKRYSYPVSFQPALSGFINTDAEALKSGYISVTPCQPDLLNFATFQQLKGKILNLQSKSTSLTNL